MVCLFSYSVYALVSQSMNVTAEITVTDEGQAKSVVSVYEALGANDNSPYTSLTSEPNFSHVFTKGRDEDNATGEFKEHPVFGGENKYRYYIIKIEIQNLSAVPITYSARITNEIGEDFVFSSQLELIYLDNLTTFDEMPLSGGIDVGESATKYIVLTVADGLEFSDLIATNAHSFYLNIKVQVDEK